MQIGVRQRLMIFFVMCGVRVQLLMLMRLLLVLIFIISQLWKWNEFMVFFFLNRMLLVLVQKCVCGGMILFFYLKMWVWMDLIFMLQFLLVCSVSQLVCCVCSGMDDDLEVFSWVSRQVLSRLMVVRVNMLVCGLVNWFFMRVLRFGVMKLLRLFRELIRVMLLVVVVLFRQLVGRVQNSGCIEMKLDVVKQKVIIVRFRLLVSVEVVILVVVMFSMVIVSW